MKKAPTCNTICSYYWFLGVQTKGAIYTMRDASCHIESGLIGLKVNLQVLLHCCTRLPRATSKWVPDPLGRASLPDRELVHQGKQRHFSDDIPMRVQAYDRQCGVPAETARLLLCLPANGFQLFSSTVHPYGRMASGLAWQQLQWF